MNSLIKTLAVLILVSLFSTATFADDRLKVVTSIKPVHSILAGLMEGIEAPLLILEDTATPFGYTLTETQHSDIATADLLVWVGPELERFLIEPLSHIAPKTTVLTLLDNPELKILPTRNSPDGDDSIRDPYFWLDSRNMLILVDELTRALMTQDSARSHLYERNRTNLIARISELDRRLEYGYRGLKKGISMNYFDTLQYFEQAYALKIHRTLLQSASDKVDASNLLKTKVDLNNGVYSCLLTDIGMKMPELALLTQGIDVNIGALDVFGTSLAAGPELYFELIQYNTQTIKNCLEFEETDVLSVEEGGLPSANDSIGGKFFLMDHNGILRTEKDLLGQFQLISFGYTSCPDVCPMTLQVIAQVMDKLDHDTDLIQPYFISVDPERDGVAKIRQYVNFFSEDIIGLTGTYAMTERVTKLFRVQVEKVPPNDGRDDSFYAIDHTASTYLMSPKGEFITKFAYGISPQQLYEGLLEYLPN